jgi:outer membrane protein TolC
VGSESASALPIVLDSGVPTQKSEVIVSPQTASTESETVSNQTEETRDRRTQPQESSEKSSNSIAIVEGIVGLFGRLFGDTTAQDKELSARRIVDDLGSANPNVGNIEPSAGIVAELLTSSELEISIQNEGAESLSSINANQSLEEPEHAGHAIELPKVIVAQPDTVYGADPQDETSTQSLMDQTSAAGVEGALQVQAEEYPSDYRDRVMQLVMNHPEVVRQYNALILAGWRVKETESRSAPRVSFTTTGKYPIADNVDQSRLRADNLDREYIDGTVQLSKPIFDAGKRELLEVSAEQRRLVEKLKYLQTFEKQLSRLLNLLIELNRDRVEEQSVTSDMAFLDESITTVRRRYELGAGTLNDIRILEIQRLDLERLLESSQRRIQLKTEALLSEYGYKESNNSWVLEITAPVTSAREGVEFVPTDSLTNRISQTEQTALEMDRQSVRAERFPEVSLTLNGVLYDLVNRPAEEYELYGGVSMNLPLFDGGERDAKIEGIEVQKTIESTSLRKSLADLQASWDEIASLIQEIETQRESDERRLASILDRLSELKIRAKTIESGLLEVTQAELQRRSVARDLVLGQISESVLLTRRAELAGRLMDLIGIEPNIQ